MKHWRMSFSVSEGDGGGTAEAFGCKNRCAGGGADGGFGCSVSGTEDGWGRGDGETRSSVLRLRLVLLLHFHGGDSAPKCCLFLSFDVLPGPVSPCEDLQASPQLLF